MKITFLILLSFLVFKGIFGQEISDTSSLFVIKGEKQNDLRTIDYNPIVNAFPRTIDRVKKIYGIDSTKLFLTGGGNSGELVWQTGCKKTDFFKAISPICGSALWLNKGNINQNNEMQISLFVGSKEHRDIYDKVIKTKDIAENIFDNFHYFEIEGADHLSIWSAALPKIMQEFELLMK